MKEKTELLKALAAFKKDCPPFKKETEAYNYKYVKLDKIHEVVYPLLEKYGLFLDQNLFSEPETFTVVTTITHLESGQDKVSTMNVAVEKMKSMNDYQSMGSGITYMRRYAIGAMLNLVTEEDTDAQGEKVKSTEPSKDKPWLNKDSQDWENVEFALKSKTATMTDVLTKFKVSKVNAQELLKIAGGQNE